MTLDPIYPEPFECETRRLGACLLFEWTDPHTGVAASNDVTVIRITLVDPRNYWDAHTISIAS